MPDKAVSVVITSLNRPQWLGEATESVLLQERKPAEVIIVDDGSGPDTLAVAEALAISYERVHVIHHPTPRGVYRNLCDLGPSLTGDYFAILNDDDRWEPGFLRELAAALDDDGDLVAAFCDHFIMDGNGAIIDSTTNANSRRYGRTSLAPGRHNNSAYLSVVGINSFPTVVASLFRNSEHLWKAYAGAEHNVAGYYDKWLQVCTLGDSSPVWFSPHRLSSYRIHDTQATSLRDPARGLADVWILEQALASQRFKRVTKCALRGIAAGYHSVGTTYLRSGDTRLAAYYLRLSLATRPNARSMACLMLCRRHLQPIVRLLGDIRR